MVERYITKFSKQLVMVMAPVMRGFLRRLSDEVAKGKITPPQYLVLDLVYNLGAQKMSGLANDLSVSFPAMTGLIERLYKQELVKRVFDEKDRRIIRIQITDKGKKLVERIRLQREKVFSEIFGKLDPKDRDDYLRILLKIKDILYAKK